MMFLPCFNLCLLMLFPKEWKHGSRKTVQKSLKKKQQKRLMVVKKVWFVNQNSSTRRQIIKVVTQNSCARFLWRNVEWVLFAVCLIEVKIGLEISRRCAKQNFAFFLHFEEEETLFSKLSFIFTKFSKQPRFLPVRIKIFYFFFLANLGCRNRSAEWIV